ncbi:tyrosine-type recombinase/integrase [Listeria seeligeri]|uniref:tyrosine-type recombinase/integrase n=1 Tax=Listeria seeligeri TaxID=1640 RepID=UPI0021AB49DD|nr:tyrosine-type recombinase/integrase [Listeria seeligeri]
MRKTFGYHLYNNGVGLELLQLLSNHSSPKITLRYIGIEQEDVQSNLAKLPKR